MSSAPAPGWVPPMLATAVPAPPAGDGWAAEIKWDGVRACLVTDGRQVRLFSRSGRPVTAAYPEIGLPGALAGRAAVLDGEIVAPDPVSGAPSFDRLQHRMHVTSPAAARRLAEASPAVLLVFDVLALAGSGAGPDWSWRDRRAALDGAGLPAAGGALPAGAGTPAVVVPPAFPGAGAATLAVARAAGLEGVVCKRLDSRYTPGRRSDDWRKVKLLRTQDVVLGGLSPGAGGRAGRVGSVLVGLPTLDGPLRYVGRVGSGFTDAALQALAGLVAAEHSATSPFAAVPAAHARGVRWLRPLRVAEVAFSAWTDAGQLRHPRWRGLRPGVQPGAIRVEPAAAGERAGG